MAKPGWVEEFKFSGAKVSMEDITAGRAPRPRVLDMFAGGGAIPFEALRLGCEAYALDLNPVAHIIQLCTLVYPQKYRQTRYGGAWYDRAEECERRDHLGRAGRRGSLLGQLGVEKG